MHPESNPEEHQFKVLGYQWHVLRFNDDTRQSTVKVMAACQPSDPGSLLLMQQSHCLAVPCMFPQTSIFFFSFLLQLRI
jgi:hypothetical protein